VLFPENRNIAKYQEFTVVPEKTKILGEEEGYEEGYVRIRFTFARAPRFYTSTIVAPTIIFTFVSFGMFLLDIRVGERLAFGVSLLLVIVANSILTADMLPVCPERVWVQVLTTASYYWVITAVLESIAVAYLYFLETEDLEAKKKKAEERDLMSATMEEEKRDQEKKDCDHADRGSFARSSSGVDSTGDGSIILPLARRKNSIEHSSHEEPLPLKDEGVSKEEGRDPHGPCPAFRKRMKWQGTLFRTMRNILFGHPSPSWTWRMNAIRRMDRCCAVVFPVSYIIFFSVMIARNKYW